MYCCIVALVLVHLAAMRWLHQVGEIATVNTVDWTNSSVCSLSTVGVCEGGGETVGEKGDIYRLFVLSNYGNILIKLINGCTKTDTVDSFNHQIHRTHSKYIYYVRNFETTSNNVSMLENLILLPN